MLVPVSNIVAPDEKNVLEKHKTAAQKQRAEIAVFDFFAQRFVGFCEINGFIVFVNLTKPPTGVKKQNCFLPDCVLGVLGALAWRLI